MERARIFIALALEVDPTPTGPSRQIVRFVTEASCRGAMRDTVTLIVGRNSPCADYIAGSRYLVLADTTADPQAALVTASCDEAWGIRSPPALRMEQVLGPPAWASPGIAGDYRLRLLATTSMPLRHGMIGHANC
jgi:hypothetical protein